MLLQEESGISQKVALFTEKRATLYLVRKCKNSVQDAYSRFSLSGTCCAAGSADKHTCDVYSASRQSPQGWSGVLVDEG